MPYILFIKTSKVLIRLGDFFFEGFEPQIFLFYSYFTLLTEHSYWLTAKIINYID